MNDRLAKLRHIVFDMDGTIYLGRTLFKETIPFLALLREFGVGYTFVTNNSSKSRAGYVRHLHEMGIVAPPDAVVTSAHATIHHIRQNLPEAKRLFVLTAEDALEDWRLGGFEIVDDEPDVLVVSWDFNLNYHRLCRTAYWLSRGVPYFATHPDRTCPTDQETVLPDCGAICALLESAIGRRPDAIPGKPSPEMIQEVMDRHGLSPSETAVIGDRLYTDVRMARDAGALAVLTLTGEANAQEALSLPAAHQPDLIVTDLDDLSRQLCAARGV
ncbi:HAD-IIA family hydrolase [Lacipirellula limnantheis]|uniref:Ribonucleotide monophosphatase NagD n=1 Tax=Lacipirellula limnantheis TaxID=2528024 RepID=A0A517TRM2_9BACT|nr:HAD-IIA family hydrolase [Lacipirellula limnantheis]QDT71020.1 Ribonucleotide monophosphatase NagD [Lacipirellula limnantheis]